MCKNFIDYDKLNLLSIGDKNVSLEFKSMKLSEEVGEFSQAMLRYLNASNVSASTDEDNTKEAVLEELMDVLNVSVDILNALGFTDSECKQMFDKKLLKWSRKQSQRN